MASPPTGATAGSAPTSGDLKTDRTYTGQKEDGTGLLYYNARYYAPVLGIFLSPDTLVPDPATVIDDNRFLYTRGNPLKYTDPSGHEPISGPLFEPEALGNSSGWGQALAIKGIDDIQMQISRRLRGRKEFQGLRNRGFGFRVFSTEEAQRILKGRELYFIGGRK